MEPVTPTVQEENKVPNSQTYASNLTRFAAYIIDALILGLTSAVLSIVVGANGSQALALILGLAYFGYFLSKEGQTPGLKFLGIKVTKEDGTLLNFGLAAVRHFVFGLVSAFTLGIGVLWALWDNKKQTLYDKIFHTCYYSVDEKTGRAKWTIGLSCCGCLLFPIIIVILVSIGVVSSAMLNQVPGAENLTPKKGAEMMNQPVIEKKVETKVTTTSYETPATSKKTYSFVDMDTATESFKAGVGACSDSAKKNPALANYDVTEYCKCAMDQTLNLKMDLETSVKYCAYYLPEEVQNLLK
jgi:uncharacterized RDD family membrane protein YckC